MKIIKFINNINKKILLLFLILIIIYFAVYILWVFPLHDLSKYQNKLWIKNLTTDLVLGINDPQRLYKIRQYEKNILTYWYCYWFFNTKQYTIWGVMHLKNKFSTKGNLRIYYYDFLKNESNKTVLEIDFTQIKTFLHNNKINIRHETNYIQEIDMDNNTMKIIIDTKQFNINFNLSIDEYYTNMPTLIPRYKLLKSICDFTETKCPDEWGSDNPLIGKILNGTFNNENIESGGNYWFDNMLGFNNYFLSEYVWFVLLNDDWLIYILLCDTIDNIKQKDVIKVLLIKDRKNDKILTCGIDTDVSSLYKNLDKLINPKTININYISKDNFTIHYEMPNFKVDIISKPNYISEKSKIVVKDYYKSNDVDIEKLNEWDKKYYNTITKFNYVELVTMANINIVYNNKNINFMDRVICDGFEFTDNKNIQHIFCKNSSDIRNYIVR